MAEVWPRLAKKLSGDGQLKKKKSNKSKSKANPFAASGLEKFAALLEGIQAKKGASLVERTASSLSAARSISRSAQEWTATTLARSASRRTSEPRQCPAFEALAPTLAIVGHLEQDVKNSTEERQPQEEESSSPVGVRLPERTSRSRSVRILHQQQGWRQTSQSALFLLVVMGTFMSSRFGTAGKSLASVLTVIQVWRQGSISSFLTPLRSYLLPRMATRLTFLPRKSKTTSPTSAPEEEDAQKSEAGVTTLGFPSVPVKESAPLSILLPIPESSASALGVGPLPMTVVRKSTGASSASRRLAKKISSRFRKLKMFSSSASSPSVSESSHHAEVASEPGSPTSRPSSPDRRRMCPFSRRLHKSESSEAELALSDDSGFGARKCIIMRRQRSSDGMLCKKSKLGRMLSSETLEEYDFSESSSSSASSSMHGKLISSSSTNVEDANLAPPRDELPWPVVGLLVTLLFLLVGRFPAIMATSLFFVVVSNHDRAYSRASRGRDNRALEAARKLQRSSPPRGQRWGATSPLRRF